MTDPELAPAVHPLGGRVRVKRKNAQKQKFYGLRAQQGRLLDVIPHLMYDDDGSALHRYLSIYNGKEEGKTWHLVGLYIRTHTHTGAVNKQKKCSFAGRMEINVDGVHKSRSWYRSN